MTLLVGVFLPPLRNGEIPGPDSWASKAIANLRQQMV
jgi:hypothetical protein